MDSGSDNESIEGQVTVKASADWGKSKHDYYYTDYVDKDYPSKLNAKEERLAAIEQEEALRIQKKLLSTLDNVDLQTVFEESAQDEGNQDSLLDFIETQNKTLSELSAINADKPPSKKIKWVHFQDKKAGSDSEEGEDVSGEDEVSDSDDKPDLEEKEGRRRRPINMAMKHNRGLTPYKKKEYRNPRVKHKLKYKRAMSKRRRNVREAQVEHHRYSGESTGIKTSTIKSIKLC